MIVDRPARAAHHLCTHPHTALSAFFSGPAPSTADMSSAATLPGFGFGCLTERGASPPACCGLCMQAWGCPLHTRRCACPTSKRACRARGRSSRRCGERGDWACRAAWPQPCHDGRGTLRYPHAAAQRNRHGQHRMICVLSEAAARRMHARWRIILDARSHAWVADGVHPTHACSRMVLELQVEAPGM